MVGWVQATKSGKKKENLQKIYLKFTAIKPGELWCSSNVVETPMHMQITSCHIVLHGQFVYICIYIHIHLHFFCLRACNTMLTLRLKRGKLLATTANIHRLWTSLEHIMEMCKFSTPTISLVRLT